MKIVLALVLLISFLSCKDEGSQQQVDKVKNMAITDPAKLKVPNACELISKESINKILGANAADITIKDASDPQQKEIRACFFQWNDPELSFPGIMIQVNTNPAYSDMPDFIPKEIENLLANGITEVDAASPNKFTEFKIDDIRGAYSFKMSRFKWNLGPNYGIMLNFNLPLSESEMVRAAQRIAREVNANLAKKI